MIPTANDPKFLHLPQTPRIILIRAGTAIVESIEWKRVRSLFRDGVVIKVGELTTFLNSNTRNSDSLTAEFAVLELMRRAIPAFLEFEYNPIAIIGFLNSSESGRIQSIYRRHGVASISLYADDGSYADLEAGAVMRCKHVLLNETDIFAKLKNRIKYTANFNSSAWMNLDVRTTHGVADESIDVSGLDSTLITSRLVHNLRVICQRVCKNIERESHD